MIDLSPIPASVQSFVTHLTDFPCVERIVLFGSRAVGDHNPRADVDIGISAPSLSRLQFARFRIAAFEARTLLWISLVHIEQTPRLLRERINQQGVTLYERKKATR